jgi:hypothetical protein
MKKQITSIFTSHYEALMALTDFESLKNKVLEIVKESRINETDKRKIVFEVENRISNLSRLQMYVTNSMLKYQGQGTR